MNPVVIVTKNCLDFTKKCVASVWAQDIPADVHLFDNCSNDGTKEWVSSDSAIVNHSWGVDLGVSAAWNYVLESLFDSGAEYALAVNNDTILPPCFYRYLLSCNVPFVTGVSVEDMAVITNPIPEPTELAPHPDFSAFLIRREAWEKVGSFDERMRLYASDCDFDIRARRAGLTLLNSLVPFYHERSSTMRLAPPHERQRIEEQANADRQVFRSKYGCIPGEPAYADLFK